MRPAALFLFPFLHLTAADWWAYQVTSNVRVPSCSVVHSESGLFQTLAGRGVNRSTLLKTFPDIPWNANWAAVAILPARKLGLPDSFVKREGSGITLHLLPSIDAHAATFVVQVPTATASCRVEIGSGKTPNAMFSQEEGSVVGGGKSDAPGRGKIKRGAMGPLRQGVGYFPASTEHTRPIASPDECSNICAADSQCKAITYIKSQKACVIKSSVPNLAQQSDMISAMKELP